MRKQRDFFLKSRAQREITIVDRLHWLYIVISIRSNEQRMSVSARDFSLIGFPRCASGFQKADSVPRRYLRRLRRLAFDQVFIGQDHD
jgi:hypothetical protein